MGGGARGVLVVGSDRTDGMIRGRGNQDELGIRFFLYGFGPFYPET